MNRARSRSCWWLQPRLGSRVYAHEVASQQSAKEAFPDFRFEVEDLIAEGDKVAARVSVSGTHLGEMMGLAPTGKRVSTSGIEVFRFEGGKIAEHWAAFEALDMLQQIGMVPIPGPTLLARTLMHQGRKLLAKARSSR